MNKIEQMAKLRSIAVRNGFDPYKDRQYYLPLGRREKNDKPYIAYNAHHALLWNPEWIRCLVGGQMVETCWVDKDTLQIVSMPRFEYVMVMLARIRAEDSGEEVEWLYQMIAKEEQERKVAEQKDGTIQANEDTS